MYFLLKYEILKATVVTLRRGKGRIIESIVLMAIIYENVRMRTLYNYHKLTIFFNT
jgi:hypothetical protein